MTYVSKRLLSKILDFLDQNPNTWFTEAEIRLGIGYKKRFSQALKPLKDTKQIAFRPHKRKYLYKKYREGDPQDYFASTFTKIVDAVRAGIDTSSKISIQLDIEISQAREYLAFLVAEGEIKRLNRTNPANPYKYKITSEAEKKKRQFIAKTISLSESDRRLALSNPSWAEMYYGLLESHPKDPQIGDRYLYSCLNPANRSKDKVSA